ncbi:hypothetical protein GALMADRAFT_222412 [Galerina marginata CBS 339.88]|uniref:Rhodopsin domain-containing protein n=1 Tax=Galerina marginata (strain CBS 339.88) TaxID=685588 RepID=A0A067TLM5_GALM3|nr:hypothetical protein GALMADRAFT_222412 [Galerina marginata CBS 339.88]
MLVLSFELTLALNVLVTVLQVMAIGLTLFRLYYRRSIQRLWWDDYTAGFAILIDFGYMPLMWFPYAPPGSRLHSNAAVEVSYWLSNILFFIGIWSARISIALAIARVFPPGDVTRKFTIGLALFFAALTTTITVQFSVVCGRQAAIKNLSSSSSCFWNLALRVVITTANFIADSCLVATPLFKLWHVRLPRKQRRLILAGFAASALTTTATIGCSIVQFGPAKWDPARQYLRVLFRYFEIAICLIACNLLVVITYIYNRLSRHEEELTRPTEPETAETSLNRESVSHSNQVPSESALSTLVLTQITDAFVYTNTSSTHHFESSRETQPSDHSSYSSS